MDPIKATRTHSNNVTVTVAAAEDGSYSVARHDSSDPAVPSPSARVGIPSWVEALDKADEWAHPGCDGTACGTWMPI
jgi:hypothetical protein